MKRIKHFLLILIGIFWSISASAQMPELVNSDQFRPDAKAAVDSIYNFQFDGADRVLSPWKEKYPSHPLWSLIEGMKFWWQVLSDLEDQSNDKQFVNMMKKANYQAGKLLHRQSSHADALIIQAISNGYIGRQYSNREEWITSLNYARKAMGTYEYLLEKEPDMPDLKLAQGLKLYYAAYLPEAYPVVKTVSWFLPDGDKEKGLNFIHEASEQAIFARAEATYFLGNINYNYENNYKAAVQHFEKLHRQYPRNNYYARILVKNYYQRDRYDQALKFIDQTLERWERDDLPFEKVMKEELLTWKGRILERRGNHQQALKLYKQAFEIGKKLPNTKGRDFWVTSGYSAGKLLHWQHKDDEAKSYLKEAAESEVSSDYREEAQKLLSQID
ncbi:tetratricopeptide repeat protein [Fodinibius salsisoli]|uniref:Tetratricopeptide repeat protein n=1 Tax=Fodinibius salsisoli TaxID=2820877 RepID=A0ABT3PP42_9BACT|nr:tetratricopeptide repeat protein [Fodinibius salsisoli]